MKSIQLYISDEEYSKYDNNSGSIDFIELKKQILFEIFCELYKNSDRKELEKIFSVKDINENKIEKERLFEAFLKIKELNVLKSRFLSVVSHELRTPLAAITSSVQLLQKFGHKWDSDKNNKLYNQIYNSIKYTNLLLNDVSFIDKNESDRIKLNIVEIEIGDFFNEIIDDIKAIFELLNPVRLIISPDIAVLYSDRILLKHILINLISNGIKYSGNEPIDLLLNIYDENNVQIVVKDYGIGIPKEDLENIFEPFFRGSNSESIKGSGLGLTIVKRCVELLNGKINVESEVNFGTKVQIIIPNIM